MPAPLKPHLFPVVLHDEDAIVQGTNANPLVVIGPGGGSVLTGLTQVQNIESVAPLGGGVTFEGGHRDCINYESFGISIYVEPDPAQAVDVTVVVKNSADGITFRTVDTIALAGAAGVAIQLNRVYSVTRQFYLVSVTNNDGTALDATEIVSMLKPV